MVAAAFYFPGNKKKMVSSFLLLFPFDAPLLSTATKERKRNIRFSRDTHTHTHIGIFSPYKTLTHTYKKTDKTKVRTHAHAHMPLRMQTHTPRLAKKLSLFHLSLYPPKIEKEEKREQVTTSLFLPSLSTSHTHTHTHARLSLRAPN